MTKPDESAFPKLRRHQSDMDIKTWLYDSVGGLTKREWYAGLAMQGICAGNNDAPEPRVVEWAVSMADALIAELAKEKP